MESACITSSGRRNPARPAAAALLASRPQLERALLGACRAPPSQSAAWSPSTSVATGSPASRRDAPRFPDGYAMDELLKDVDFVIAELGLEKPVVVGHSWGATVALELVGTRQGIAGGLVFIDGPVQSAANLFSWEEAQKLMQPPLPRFTSFEEAVAQSKRDFEGAWDQDLESFVKARIVPDGDAMVLTLTAPVRLELLRGLYEAQPDVLWPRVEVPAAALLARHGPARIATSREVGCGQAGGAGAERRDQLVRFAARHPAVHAGRGRCGDRARCDARCRRCVRGDRRIGASAPPAGRRRR